MILQKEVYGFFATNSYFYIDDETRCGFLIAPGAQFDELLKIIVREIDHIGAIDELQALQRERFRCVRGRFDFFNSFGRTDFSGANSQKKSSVVYRRLKSFSEKEKSPRRALLVRCDNFFAESKKFFYLRERIHGGISISTLEG